MLRIRRVIVRTFRDRGRSRPDLAPDCPEVLGRQTIDFLRFIWRTRETSRQAIQRIIARDLAHLRVIHLCRASDVMPFVRACRAGPDGQGLRLPYGWAGSAAA